MKIILTAILSFGTFLFSEAQNKLDTSKYVILPNTVKWSPWSVDKKYKSETLKESEIIQTELILSKCINKYNISQTRYYEIEKKEFPEHELNIENYIIKLDKYKRQFIAVSNSKGEKEVWVNCFRPSLNNDKSYWRQTIVTVDDGGNYYFNVKINLTKKKYYDLSVNGN